MKHSISVKTADYMLTLITVAFGVACLIYASSYIYISDKMIETSGNNVISLLRDFSRGLSIAVPLAMIGASFLLMGYIELRFFSVTEEMHNISHLVEEEEKILEEEKELLKKIESHEAEIEKSLKK